MPVETAVGGQLQHATETTVERPWTGFVARYILFLIRYFKEWWYFTQYNWEGERTELLNDCNSIYN